MKSTASGFVLLGGRVGHDCCKLLLRGLAAFFVVLVCIAPALGQGAGTASLSGTVTDPHGAAVSGAKVIIHNVETGIERVLATNEQGFYAAPLLQPGTYDVRVTQAGFAELLRKNIRLAVGQTLAIDVQLSVQSAQQSVTVSEEVGVVETEKTDLSNLITQTQVENLPLNGRRWDNLVLLTPGVSEDGVKSTRLSQRRPLDRKSTRLNSSHLVISYAVFCLKKKK